MKQRSVSKELTVKWVDKNTGGGMPKIPAKTALYVNEEIKLLGGTLEGNGYIQSIKNNSVQIGTYGSFRESTLHYSNQTTPDKLINYPDYMKDKLPNLSTQIENINFQEYGTVIEQIRAPKITEKLPFKKIGTHTVQDENGNLNLTFNQESQYKLTLDSDIYIPKLETFGGAKLSIDTGETDKTILVNNLNIGGDVLVEGKGMLTIVIKDSFAINSGGISFRENQNFKKILLVYLGEKDLQLANDIKINAHILVKKANVNVNSISINGVFLAGGENINFSGQNTISNMMLIAPNRKGTVSLTGSYHIEGTVIANKFMMSGGSTTLKYKSVVTTGFPFGSSGTTSDPKPEDIINSGTIIED
ncbi:MAG: hypothetical protein RR649_07000 [Carnobacterium sp.]